MCGITGCVGKIWRQEEEAFKLLLQLDTIRGPHSTGVLSLGTSIDKWSYLKVAGTPWELFSCKGWSSMWSGVHRLLLGHNRWATVGEITDENAHPFHHGNFVGVHNGTLRSRVGLSNSKDFEVDSENIFYNMDKEGVEETLKKLNGAFALVWYNIEKGCVQMVRNSERPLYICSSEDKKTFFWASEEWMLRVALSKNGIKHTEPVLVEEKKLISIDIPTDLSKMDDFLPRVKEVEFYKPPAQDYHSHSTWYSKDFLKEEKKNTGGVIRNINTLRGYLNKVVQFSVIRKVHSKIGDHILCEVEDNMHTEIKIFANEKTKLGKLLLSSPSMFLGKVKSCTSKEPFGSYLTLDHRSISETLLEKEVEVEKYVPGNRGNLITLESWYKKTSRGCSWCSTFPKVQDADYITWFSEDEFLCVDCAKDETITQYII